MSLATLNSQKKVIAVVLGGGTGSRMGSAQGKQFLKLHDKPIISYSIAVFENSPLVDEIYLVVPESDFMKAQNELIAEYNFKKIKKIVPSGAERFLSSYNAINAITDHDSIVMIHDGARMFVDEKMIEQSAKIALEHDGGCVVGVKSKDTIKIVDENGVIISTPDRNFLRNVQTPQTFKYEVIKKALDVGVEQNFKGTDDASFVEKIGLEVRVVEGSYDNIKITTPEDLDVAEKILHKKMAEKIMKK